MAEPNPSHVLQVIPDKKGHSFAKKLYEAYIMKKEEDGGDYARLPEFTIALDKLLSEFGGHPAEVEPKEDEEEDIPEDGDDTDFEDDEDYDETASLDVERVKIAVAKVLGGKK